MHFQDFFVFVFHGVLFKLAGKSAALVQATQRLRFLILIETRRRQLAAAFAAFQAAHHHAQAPHHPAAATTRGQGAHHHAQAAHHHAQAASPKAQVGRRQAQAASQAHHAHHAQAAHHHAAARHQTRHQARERIPIPTTQPGR